VVTLGRYGAMLRARYNGVGRPCDSTKTTGRTVYRYSGVACYRSRGNTCSRLCVPPLYRLPA